MIALVLSQVQPNYHELGLWIACLAVVLNLGLSITRMYMQVTGKPERRDVSFTKEAASRADLERHIQDNRAAHALIYQKIDGVHSEFQGKLDDSMEKVHEKINGVAREVSSVMASVELQTQQLARIDTKLDGIAHRAGRH